MIFVGIDCGKQGGIVVIDEKENIMEKHIMPVIKIGKKIEYDIERISFLVSRWYEMKDAHVFVEKQYPRPITSKRACFDIGYGYGILLTALKISGLSTEIVTPQTWMKVMKISSKNGKGSISYCLKKYPKEDWTATERAKKVADGLTDACAIAIYGKRLIHGKDKDPAYFNRLLGRSS